MPADLPYSGRIDGDTHLFAVRVYYEDTDAGGVTYHASYLRFMERARTDLLALCGIDLAGSHSSGEGLYVVADLSIRYRRPSRLGEALLVSSRFERIGGTSLVVQQRVSSAGAEVADATVRVVFVGPNGRPRRQPAPWIAAFRAITGD